VTEITEASLADRKREALVRKGILLSYATIGYNSLEAIGSLIAGVLAGSVALVGFGIDSVLEVLASGAAQWRLRSDLDPAKRQRVELQTMRVIGLSFLALAVYILLDAARTIWNREAPQRSPLGIIVLTLSVIVMPVLARSKKRVARELRSGALEAEAKQTSLCAYLSGIALVGVLLNALLGWWWADPGAALLMVPIIAREGVEGIRVSRH
jgi:divalent metal cation (Fe/Co/Zn/Cd) transporter